MKSLMYKIWVVAVLSVVLVACSKEEVKPFNSGGSAATNFSTKSATGDSDNASDATDSQNSVGAGEDETGVTEEDGSGITDGGTSSDYDSKGTKRKPSKN